MVSPACVGGSHWEPSLESSDLAGARQCRRLVGGVHGLGISVGALPTLAGILLHEVRASAQTMGTCSKPGAREVTTLVSAED